ncbi:phosphoribosyltransferase [Rhizobium leguminosarum]|uniref:Phosphoribosyl transferase domain family protein n=1 Tax=Rhizobium leguminosarum TaxID=384 RepID=A0A2Z4YUR4_RHILE|nr:phosphoribosyltransferase [Rhizobium leguminosarum]AXA45164.1 Phosphoribosyl transferase domain family protein [Rhizobium leguminosarum]
MLRLIADIQAAPRARLNGREYDIYSVGENGFFLKADLIREVADGLTEMLEPELRNDAKLCAIAPGGNPWGLLVAHALGKPLHVLRPHLSRDGQGFKLRTEKFEDGDIVAENLVENDSVVVLDDVIGSGRVARKVIQWSIKSKLQIKAFCTIVDKGTGGGDLLAEQKIQARSLLQL